MIDARLQLDGDLDRVPFVALPAFMPGQNATLYVRVRGVPSQTTVTRALFTAKDATGAVVLAKDINLIDAANAGVVAPAGASGAARLTIRLIPAELPSNLPARLVWDVWCFLSDGRRAPCVKGTITREEPVTTSFAGLPGISVASIVLTGASSPIIVGTTEDVTATVLDVLSAPLAGKTVTAASTAAAVTVSYPAGQITNAAGQVVVRLTAVSDGPASITASSESITTAPLVLDSVAIPAVTLDWLIPRDGATPAVYVPGFPPVADLSDTDIIVRQEAWSIHDPVAQTLNVYGRHHGNVYTAPLTGDAEQRNGAAYVGLVNDSAIASTAVIDANSVASRQSSEWTMPAYVPGTVEPIAGTNDGNLRGPTLTFNLGTSADRYRTGLPSLYAVFYVKAKDVTQAGTALDFEVWIQPHSTGSTLLSTRRVILQWDADRTKGWQRVALNNPLGQATYVIHGPPLASRATDFLLLFKPQQLAGMAPTDAATDGAFDIHTVLGLGSQNLSRNSWMFDGFLRNGLIQIGVEGTGSGWQASRTPIPGVQHHGYYYNRAHLLTGGSLGFSGDEFHMHYYAADLDPTFTVKRFWVGFVVAPIPDVVGFTFPDPANFSCSVVNTRVNVTGGLMTISACQRAAPALRMADGTSVYWFEVDPSAYNVNAATNSYWKVHVINNGPAVDFLTYGIGVVPESYSGRDTGYRPVEWFAPAFSEGASGNTTPTSDGAPRVGGTRVQLLDLSQYLSTVQGAMFIRHSLPYDPYTVWQRDGTNTAFKLSDAGPFGEAGFDHTISFEGRGDGKLHLFWYDSVGSGYANDPHNGNYQNALNLDFQITAAGQFPAFVEFELGAIWKNGVTEYWIRTLGINGGVGQWYNLSGAVLSTPSVFPSSRPAESPTNGYWYDYGDGLQRAVFGGQAPLFKTDPVMRYYVNMDRDLQLHDMGRRKVTMMSKLAWTRRQFAARLGSYGPMMDYRAGFPGTALP